MISIGLISTLLDEALAHTGLLDPATGEPLHFMPHDFRRIFITDAVLNGLPPHIAQVIAGHSDINVTMGYKAVYPEEVIQAHLAFLARRRALRPMLWPDPAPRARLVEIRDNLTARIAEARREGWRGEVNGLQISLDGTEAKLAQIDRRPNPTPISITLPRPTLT